MIRWLFTLINEPWFCIAGLVLPGPDQRAAFTMLTVEPGLGIVPYHRRQVVVLGRTLGPGG